MRKSLRIVKALVIASILSGGLMIGRPVHAADSGLGSGNSFACAWAQQILEKIGDKPGHAIVKDVFGRILEAFDCGLN